MNPVHSEIKIVGFVCYVHTKVFVVIRGHSNYIASPIHLCEGKHHPLTNHLMKCLHTS